ncbi:MAG: MEKHLA domain-containing protein [Methylococcaceae bacterium]|nr:MEKHLA domain-containing protein [Methylococcaceae bacterium]
MGRERVDPRMSDGEAARSPFHARFALVSHDAALDPVFDYSNRTALDLRHELGNYRLLAFALMDGIGLAG